MRVCERGIVTCLVNNWVPLTTPWWWPTWTQDAYTFPAHLSSNREAGHCHSEREDQDGLPHWVDSVLWWKVHADEEAGQVPFITSSEVVKVADHQCDLWTVQVGSREIIDELSFSALAGPCSTTKQDEANLHFQLARTFLHESFTV